MKKNLREQNCPDCCGSVGLPLWHLRNSHGDQREGLLAAISNRIHLGLDLQGGAHLILQVQVSEAVNAETDNTVQEIQQDSEDRPTSPFRRCTSPIPTSRSDRGGGRHSRAERALCARCSTHKVFQ